MINSLNIGDHKRISQQYKNRIDIIFYKIHCWNSANTSEHGKTSLHVAFTASLQLKTQQKKHRRSIFTYFLSINKPTLINTVICFKLWLLLLFNFTVGL